MDNEIIRQFLERINDARGDLYDILNEYEGNFHILEHFRILLSNLDSRLKHIEQDLEEYWLNPKGNKEGEDNG